MSDIVQDIAASDFESATQTGVVLVDFYAVWCGPCRRQAVILDQVAPDFAGRAKIIKVDTDKAQDIAARFGVQSIPTLVLLKNGEKVAQFVGMQQAETLTTALEKALG